MRITDLNEYRQKKILRQFRRTGEFSKQLGNSTDTQYNNDAFIYNHALGVLLTESKYNNLLVYLRSFDKKYPIFGIKNKYRSLSILFSLHQEYERIQFIPRKYRTNYDVYVLESIVSNLPYIKEDIRQIMVMIDHLNISHDHRVYTIYDRLYNILTYLANA